MRTLVLWDDVPDALRATEDRLLAFDQRERERRVNWWNGASDEVRDLVGQGYDPIDNHTGESWIRYHRVLLTAPKCEIAVRWNADAPYVPCAGSPRIGHRFCISHQRQWHWWNDVRRFFAIARRVIGV